MASRLFEGKNVIKTLKNIIKRCEVCQKNNPKTEKLEKSGLQRSGNYPGEDWEIDFTHMPKANDIIKKHLHKLTQETQDNWIKVLPIALMRARTAPKKEGLFAFECI